MRPSLMANKQTWDVADISFSQFIQSKNRVSPYVQQSLWKKVIEHGFNTGVLNVIVNIGHFDKLM